MNSANLLQTAVAAPLVASVLLFLAKSAPLAARKAIALVGFALPCAIAIALFCLFSGAKDTATGYAFFSECPWIGVESLGVGLKLGLNGISLPLFVMAAVVGLAAGWRALATKDAKMPTLYYATLLFIETGLLGLFASVDVFAFYIFHEFALIPTFIAILVWGGCARKNAAITMAVYLTLGAMISLAGLIAFYVNLDAGVPFDFIAIKNALVSFDAGTQSTLFALLLFGFGILVSLFPFHSWAPDTYSAAPTPVSMLHAGVLKKFGLYGLIQLGAAFLPLGLAGWSNWILALALGNVLVIGLITMVQRDLKHMVSYSSVAHMGPIFLGIAAFAFSGGEVTGLGAAVMMMFAHGLSVALMFHLTQSVADRTGTLDMPSMGGLASRAPVLAGFFVAATMASVGLPGFANFWGELSIFVSLASLRPFWLVALVVASIVISAIYGLRAVARVFYGKPNAETLPPEKFDAIRDITPAERVPALLLFAALVAVGFVPSLVTDELNPALDKLVSEPCVECAAAECTECVVAEVPAEAAPAPAVTEAVPAPQQ